MRVDKEYSAGKLDSFAHELKTEVRRGIDSQHAEALTIVCNAETYRIGVFIEDKDNSCRVGMSYGIRHCLACELIHEQMDQGATAHRSYDSLNTHVRRCFYLVH